VCSITRYDALMSFADKAFYYPTSKHYDHPLDYDLAFEDVFFPSSEGVTLHGWFFPVTDAVGTVLHAHGNAGNISGHFPFVGWLPARGWNVLCFDYRGYGRSTGRITRPGMVDDVRAAASYVHGRADVASNRVVLFGQSIVSA
jgi:alpha-beta hydrolase superfamily lysophospholipase